MDLLPRPSVTLDDADVWAALRAMVRIINPLLDVLWHTDPLGLKHRTGDSPGGPFDTVLDSVSWALNAADVPGTAAWDELDLDERINWWVWRIGALNTVAVAYPALLGAVARRLPVQDLLGFANQAIVLCSVAREMGVTDPRVQSRMLAEVLCERRIGDPVDVDAPAEHPDRIEWSPRGLAQSLWQLIGLLDAVSDELAKRPQPRAPFRYLGMLPAIGALASFFGECGALARAAKRGRRWVADDSRRIGV